MLGVDVSRYQGEVDWPALRRGRRDLRFAIVRLAEWRIEREGVDEQAAANIDGARSAGLVVGTYVRVEPTLHTAEEAALQWASYRGLFGADDRGLLVPAFDIEDNTRNWSGWVDEFITITRALNRRHDNRMIIYTSGSFPDAAYPTGWDRGDQDIALWIAHYAAAAGATPYTFGGRTALHQYSNKGRVPGITPAPGVSGEVDLNSTVGAWSLADLMNR
jgi:GH25 family lysozyme M1 (1,4-beta-N-acetylmuramidase)